MNHPMANSAYISRMRSFQESLMYDSCSVYRSNSSVTWPRTSSTTIPCRVGEVKTFPDSGDPQDSSLKALSLWSFTMPHDFPVEVSDIINYGGSSYIVGETNKPQSWLVASRAVATRQKTAVSLSSIIFRRRDFDTGSITTVATYSVRVVFTKEDPIEIPSRYSLAANASFRSVRLVFPDGIQPIVQKDDTFEYEGKFGFITTIIPNQPLRVEAMAMIDFGGSR